MLSSRSGEGKQPFQGDLMESVLVLSVAVLVIAIEQNRKVDCLFRGSHAQRINYDYAHEEAHHLFYTILQES